MIHDPLTESAVRAALGRRPFKLFDRVESTQDIARAWAQFGDLGEPAPAGAVVVADYQSAGRGRLGRAWIAPPGTCLMFSVVLRPTLIPSRMPRVSIVGGLAVAETLAAFDPPGLTLKWPNDVLVGGRKVCGVLAEAVWEGSTLAGVILGIGLNIRADFAGTGLEDTAISLEHAIGRAVDRRAILANLLAHVDRWTAAASTPLLIEAWQNWLGTLGRRVTVCLNPLADCTEQFDGMAEAVDEEGALLVRLDSGEQRRVIAADVTLRA